MQILGRLLGIILATLFVLLVVGYAAAVYQQPIDPFNKAECLLRAVTPYQKAQCRMDRR